MRNGLVNTSTAILVAIGALAVLLVPLVAGAQGKLTKDMFVASDTDGYDKGLPIGATFPPLKAVYQGEVISNLQPFIHDKGMVFIANRSADW